MVINDHDWPLRICPYIGGAAWVIMPLHPKWDYLFLILYQTPSWGKKVVQEQCAFRINGNLYKHISDCTNWWWFTASLIIVIISSMWKLKLNKYLQQCLNVVICGFILCNLLEI